MFVFLKTIVVASFTNIQLTRFLLFLHCILAVYYFYHKIVCQNNRDKIFTESVSYCKSLNHCRIPECLNEGDVGSRNSDHLLDLPVCRNAAILEVFSRVTDYVK